MHLQNVLSHLNNSTQMVIYKILAIILLLISVLYFVQAVWIQISTVLLGITMVAAVYINHIYTYWERAGIPSIGGSFPFGTLKEAIMKRTSITELIGDLYKRMGSAKYIGIYGFVQPQLLVKDLEIVKSILVKDFSNFADRGIFVDTKFDPLTGNLFSLEGVRWKNLRAKISPSFTSGKLKAMFSTVQSVAKDLRNYTESLTSTKDQVDIKDLTGRFGLDVISSVALGIEGNNFKEYNTEMRRITQLVTAPSGLETLRFIYHMFCRDISKIFKVKSVPKAVEDFFFHITEDTIKYRKENNVRRNDFLQLLMNLEDDNNMNGAKVDENKGQISLSLSEMAAQSFVFVVAGYETTSVTLGFLLYEMALHPDMQERLTAELDSVGQDAQYEELLKLPYLEMVINETLRKHPPLPILQRECLKDYTLPDGKIIKAGTVCMIPVFGFHRDPKLYPNPEAFDPERFNNENIKNIKPYSYLPFGEGPRTCIGNRFAMMQLKLALLALFSRFNVKLTENTPVPVKIERKTFVYNSEGGLWLCLIDRNRKKE